MGGGWVEYAWRNRPDAPLLSRGCYVAKVHVGGPAGKALGRSSSHGNFAANASYSSLAALAALAEDDDPVETTNSGGASAASGAQLFTQAPAAGTRTLVVGVGYFGGSAEGVEGVDAMPKWRSAAMSASVVLQQQLQEAAQRSRVCGTSVDDAIAAAVLDDQGILTAAAAEALSQDDSGMPQMVSTLLQPARSAAALGLYGIVFDTQGRFIANGGSPAFVGRTLTDVLAAADVGELRLLQRFLAVARRGGGWVTYSYRAAAGQPLRAKAAFVTRLAPPAAGSPQDLEGLYASGLYAAVCYGGGDAEERHPMPGQLQPPPPVAPSRSTVKAAALLLKRLLGSASSVSDVIAVVTDTSGALAAAAAEGLCWEVTRLPSNVAKPRSLSM